MQTAQLQTLQDADGFIFTLVIDSVSGSPWTVYLVNDTRPWTIAGQVYTGTRFDLSFPDQVTGELPRASIRITNVGREFSSLMEALPDNAKLTSTLQMRSRATPGQVERSFVARLSGVTADAKVISAYVASDQELEQQTCWIVADPTTTPELFAG